MRFDPLQICRGRHPGSGWAASPAAATAALLLAGAGNALDGVTLTIGNVSGPGWSADGIAVNLELPRERASATISRLRLHSWSQELRDVRIDCPRLELSGTVIACQQARVSASWPAIGPQSLRASVSYRRRDGSLDLAVEDVRLGTGRAAIAASLHNDGWSAAAQLKRVPVAMLLKLAADLQWPAPAWSAEGSITLAASLRGTRQGLHESAVNGSLTDLTVSNQSGSLASDKLALQLQATLRKAAGAWEFSAELHCAQGQAYLQPIFLDLGAHRLSVGARGRLQDARLLTIERFSIAHAAIAQAAGGALVDLGHERPLRSLDVELASLEFPGAYASYFQPWLIDTHFKSMTTAGKIAGRLVVENGAPKAIDLNLNDLTVADGARNFALSGLQGVWHWRSHGELADEGRDAAQEHTAAQSRLHWRDGAVFGLELGAGELQFISSGRQVRLVQPARLALLDGAVALESFLIRNVGLPQIAFIIDAALEPISVQRLCKAFGWPEFGGSIGGTISKLRLRDGVVTLGTTLRARVFDGEVTISDLRLEGPFGPWPRLYSNIALDRLDLQLVTRAFAFGRITGRLSGAIEGLHLFNWTPVAFDARLYTPADDRSRHRISQRAVANIGSIGGGAGVTAALSSGFLRFFDDFNYEGLGLSCRLENEVCAMNGVAPAPNGGYYLVKGRGLPRIDVIGSARRVDWPRLVQQLKAVTESEGPVLR